jgi:hypothetical protein
MTKTDKQIQKIKQHKRADLILLRSNERYKNDVRGILIHKSLDYNIIETLENEKYLLDCGLYNLEYEYSPKFKQHLWELKGTEPRNEIKFHKGTKAEHSEGCILLRDNALDYLHSILDNNKVYKIKIL